MLLDITAQREFKFTQRHFNKLRELASDYAGLHISDDKMEMYYARIAKILRAKGIEGFDQYIKLIGNDRKAFLEFVNSITTNVTSFARENHHFAILRENCLQSNSPVFRVWSAGCSTGQEPYNIAMELWDICQRKGVTLEVIASDIDYNVLRHAKQGKYALDDVDVMSREVVRRFFFRGTGPNSGYCKVKPLIQHHVKFERLNLAERFHFDQPFNAIFCRNVMIYFTSEVRSRVVSGFHRELKAEGKLFLGHSESLKNVSSDFESLGDTVYKRL